MSPDGDTGYVTANSGTIGGDTVTPIDLATGAVGTPISLSGLSGNKGDDVLGVTLSSNGQWAYALNATDNGEPYEYADVDPINLADDTLGTPIDVGAVASAFAQGPPISGAPASADGMAKGGSSKTNSTCTSGQWPINCASGDFWHTFTDASVPGRGPGLNLTRTYNSLWASTEGIFGYGWSSSYDSHLTFNSDGSVTVTEADGSQVTAQPNGSGGYVLPGWADSSLTYNGTSSTWSFVRQATMTFTYNSSGKLTAITDPNGYSTTLSYSSGQLSTVTDSAGRTLTFTYNTNGLVASVTDPMGRETVYGYTGSDLTSVTDPMSRVTSFTYYSGTNLVETMTDPNGGVVTNVYDSQGRVTQQTDPAGLVTTYAYTGNNFAGSGTTTITDPHGNVEEQSYTNGTLTSLTKGVGTSSPQTWTYSYDPSTLGLTSV